ncbi:2'-5' RNA ligase family protein [Pelomonas sp. SE-A7]|uniref:2'-5' RNA ligase family protein n=1 Tax=Pelomonas sp. SE-A7 TaxID=3054953 RepID=UPI00259D2ABB|nr:2'-5' RNA ligase family protein [Pelomonas sp. SE-A7]MDM4765755.1 2'-5' RNA ligase family protein [Pelomonas sp. SE-A7]
MAETEPAADLRPVRTDRLFFALRPPEAALAAVLRRREQLVQQLGLPGRPLKAEHLHITLHHLGDFPAFPAALVHKLTAAAHSLHVPAVDVRLDTAMSFPRRSRRNNPFVLLAGEPLEPLRALQQSLSVSLQAAGVEIDQGRFKPHLTLLYDDALVDLQAIEPLGWTARELLLVDSLLGQTRHVVLGRWPLHD